MSARAIIGLLAGLVAIVAGTAALLLLLRNDTTTVLDADQARAAASVTTASSSPPGPAERATDGPTSSAAVTYIYDTIGFEDVDALVGARHDYPAETFLTIQPGGCGTMLRWQAIEERWTSWEVCDTDLLTMAGFDSFHQWFGVGDLQEYRCDDSATLLPQEAGVASWTFACSARDRTEEVTGEVIGVEILDVGGAQVEALHIRFTAVLSGESTGNRVTDRWFRPNDALLVKEVGSTTSASSSAIGTVNYTEEYEIVLQTLDPMG